MDRQQCQQTERSRTATYVYIYTVYRHFQNFTHLSKENTQLTQMDVSYSKRKLTGNVAILMATDVMSQLSLAVAVPDNPAMRESWAAA